MADGTSAGSKLPRSSTGLASEAPEAQLDYKKMYERISTMASIGVWEFDLLNHELRWTDAVYDLYELPRGTPVDREMIGHCYSAETRLEVERRRSHAIATGGSFDIDVAITTFSGSRRWVHLTADVEQEAGVSVRIFGTQQDITERKNAQEHVQKLQRELVHQSGRNGMSSMAGTLAHELNQPLAAISNYITGVERLLKPIDLPELAGIGLNQIKENALRAGEIIRGMRSMAERGRGRAQKFDLADVLQEAVASACPINAQGFVNIQLDHRGTVLGDPVQMMQVASNLLRNACEAMAGSEEQEIRIVSRDDGVFVNIAISDNGPGLPDDLKLFEPTPSAKVNGMGIGLSICRTIVEANGGKIWVEPSKAGATICFSLPQEEISP